jgi:hypothetical protein
VRRPQRTPAYMGPRPQGGMLGESSGLGSDLWTDAFEPGLLVNLLALAGAVYSHERGPARQRFVHVPENIRLG